MLNRLKHIIVLPILLFGFMHAGAQVAMPDTVCIGATRLYHVNNPATPSTYTWTINGVTQNSTSNEISITWNTAGVYLLTVQEHPASGCDGDVRSGLVYVNPPPVANAGPDAIICFGKTTRLNGSGGDLYQWTPSAYLSNSTIANPIVSIPVAGTYNYVLNVSSNNGCPSVKSDTVSVTILPPVKIFAGNDTSVTINQPLQLNAVDVNNSGIVNYSWSPSFGLNNPTINNPIAILNNSITYKVTGRTTNGCEATDDITIKVFEKADLYVPTGFTPNGDGLNDVLKVIPVGIKELKYFSIYNRWGELVFTTSNSSIGWNGIYKGKQQDTYVFVWEAKGIDFNGNTIFRKGTAVLIR